MATTGEALIDALSLRLRDAGNTAHSRDLIRRILSHTQRAVNLAQKVRKTDTTAFTPSAFRTLYRTTEIAADVGHIERIRVLDRTLPEIPWSQLVNNSRTWLQDVGSRHRVWSRIGGTLFVLAPRIHTPVAVNVVYTTIPADVVDDATNVDLPDEWLPLVLDLAEAVMLMKARLYAPMEDVMQRVMTMLEQKPPLSGATVSP